VAVVADIEVEEVGVGVDHVDDLAEGVGQRGRGGVG